MDVKRKFTPVISVRAIWLCMTWLVSVTSTAQVNFSTVVDPTTVSRNQVVHVEYVVENAKTVEDFDAPSFRNFAVLQGPVQSSGMSFVNGSLTQYKALVFLLQPRKTGKLIIPGATATIDGQRRQSKAVAIEVTNSRTSGPSSTRPLRFNLSRVRVEADREFVLYPNENVVEKIKKNLFVKVEVDKKTCFVNEPVIATYKLYSRLRSESRVVKRPSYNGFSVYDMSEPESGNPAVETVNGKQYNVHVVRQSQLFPLQSGDFVLDPVEIENTVRFIKAESEQDSYHEEITDPYAETVEHTLTLGSAPVTITVKPLPPGTVGFDGAVGKFSVKASLKSPVVKAGESTTLLVEIKGNGNIPMINAPVINWPAGLDAFDPSAREEIHAETAPLSGVKTFEYIFTPKDTGRVELPPVTFTFFDPASKTYKTDSSEGLSIQVVAGEKKKTGSKPVIPFIANPPAGRIWIWMGAGALVTLLIIAFVVSRSSKRNQPIVKTTQKRDIALDQVIEERPDPLQKSKQMLGVSGSGAFVREVESTIWSEAAEKLKIPQVALNQTQVISQLRNKGADELTIELFREIMTDCQTALYIPGQSAEDLQGILDKAEKFLGRLHAIS